jgi:hypothetical protein
MPTIGRGPVRGKRETPTKSVGLPVPRSTAWFVANGAPTWRYIRVRLARPLRCASLSSPAARCLPREDRYGLRPIRRSLKEAIK